MQILRWLQSVRQCDAHCVGETKEQPQHLLRCFMSIYTVVEAMTQAYFEVLFSTAAAHFWTVIPILACFNFNWLLPSHKSSLQCSILDPC